MNFYIKLIGILWTCMVIPSFSAITWGEDYSTLTTDKQRYKHIVPRYNAAKETLRIHAQTLIEILPPSYEPEGWKRATILKKMDFIPNIFENILQNGLSNSFLNSKVEAPSKPNRLRTVSTPSTASSVKSSQVNFLEEVSKLLEETTAINESYERYLQRMRSILAIEIFSLRDIESAASHFIQGKQEEATSKRIKEEVARQVEAELQRRSTLTDIGPSQLTEASSLLPSSPPQSTSGCCVIL